MTQALAGNEAVYVEANTNEELLFNIQCYTHTLPGDENMGQVTPWPLVSVIDFGFDHPILNAGIVFVDSPGLSDANSTRANNAKKHHRGCTHKITVADIARALDDMSLRENLAAGSGNTILVITKGDNIDPDTELSGSTLEKRNEQKLRDDLKELTKERSNLRTKRGKVGRLEKEDISFEIEQVQQRMQVLLVQLDTLRMDMRNRMVLKTIKEQIRLSRATHVRCRLSWLVTTRTRSGKRAASRPRSQACLSSKRASQNSAIESIRSRQKGS